MIFHFSPLLSYTALFSPCWETESFVLAVAPPQTHKTKTCTLPFIQLHLPRISEWKALTDPIWQPDYASKATNPGDFKTYKHKHASEKRLKQKGQLPPDRLTCHRAIQNKAPLFTPQCLQLSFCFLNKNLNIDYTA